MPPGTRPIRNQVRRTSNEVENHTGPGPYIAKVVSHMDQEYKGSLLVQLLPAQLTGNNESIRGETITVRYASPFYGITPELGLADQDSYAYTQKSYGFWAVPPDVGSKVLVMFVEGRRDMGYWFACVPEDKMNFMIPDGRPATTLTTPATPQNLQGRKLPVGEYNKAITPGNNNDPTTFVKPYNKDFTEILEVQGLLMDEARGTTSTSARREVPSMVFGMSTPGPLDKRGNAPTHMRGTEGKEAEVPSSRLGGSSFVMDDGDEKFIRVTHASDGPPLYVNKEAGEAGGDETIPQNELLRFRTRTGHQILLHNSEDLIYIANSRGTAWIELSSDGKIDIHAQDSISIMSDQDINFTAERDFNIDAGRNINMKASARYSDGQPTLNGKESGRIHLESRYDTKVKVDRDLQVDVKNDSDWNTLKDLKLTTNANTHILSNQNIYVTANVSFHQQAGQSIFRNSGSDIYDSVAGTLYQTIGGNIDCTTGGSVNQTANGNISLLAAGSGYLTGTSGVHILSGQSAYISGASNINLKAAGVLAGDAGEVHWNSGIAGSAASADPAATTGAVPTPATPATTVPNLPTITLPYVIPGAEQPLPYESILARAPQHEPWTHHENYNPQAFKPEETDREIAGDLPSNDYVVTVDTFLKGRTGVTSTYVNGSGGGVANNGCMSSDGTPVRVAAPEGRDGAEFRTGNGPLATVRSRSGRTAEVAEVFREAFQGFIDDLEATGYEIRVMGGYANRNAVGQSVPSYHASGAAIDINPDQNGFFRPRRNPTPTDMPANTGQIAARHGLGWGGNWNSCSDAMHFSAARREGGAWDIPRNGRIPFPVEQQTVPSTETDNPNFTAPTTPEGSDSSNGNTVTAPVVGPQ